MSWILNDYRNKLKAKIKGEITYDELQGEIEKIKEKCDIKGFHLDGIIVKEPIKVRDVLENIKKDVLKLYPNAEFEVGYNDEVTLTSSSGQVILEDTIHNPNYVVIKVGEYRIFIDNTGFGEEIWTHQNIYTLLDEASSKILDLLAEKYYGLKRPNSPSSKKRNQVDFCSMRIS